MSSLPGCAQAQAVLFWKVYDVQNLFRKEAWSLHPCTAVPVPVQELEDGLLGVWSLDLGIGGSLGQKGSWNCPNTSLVSLSINQQAINSLYRLKWASVPSDKCSDLECFFHTSQSNEPTFCICPLWKLIMELERNSVKVKVLPQLACILWPPRVSTVHLLASFG